MQFLLKQPVKPEVETGNEANLAGLNEELRNKS